jgi:chromate transporter
MHRIFVDKRRDLSEKELFELNTFCSLLPGASSTQLLILIAHRKGGVALSIITLMVWILPATLLMGSLAIILTKDNSHKDPLQLFRYLQPMVVGFIIYSAYRSFLQIKHNKISVGIALFLSLVCLSFYKAPLIVPIILLIGGLIAWYTTRRKISTTTIHRPTVRWFHLTLFFLVFVISGSLSELSKKYQWSERSYFNLFENCYRFGSIVFGGGDVMIPMMYEQYVARPTSQRIKTRNQQVLKIDKDLFLSGAGVVRTIPGPVFSFSAFIGGSAMSGRGTLHQVGGIITATLAIFLPSLLLVVFFYPLWEYIHSNEALMPIFKGIQASTVSFMIASALYLSKDAILFQSDHAFTIQPINALGVLMTLLFLQFRVLTPLFITILFFSLGIIV